MHADFGPPIQNTCCPEILGSEPAGMGKAKIKFSKKTFKTSLLGAFFFVLPGLVLRVSSAPPTKLLKNHPFSPKEVRCPPSIGHEVPP